MYPHLTLLGIRHGSRVVERPNLLREQTAAVRRPFFGTYTLCAAGQPLLRSHKFFPGTVSEACWIHRTSREKIHRTFGTFRGTVRMLYPQRYVARTHSRKIWPYPKVQGRLIQGTEAEQPLGDGTVFEASENHATFERRKCQALTNHACKCSHRIQCKLDQHYERRNGQIFRGTDILARSPDPTRWPTNNVVTLLTRHGNVDYQQLHRALP